MVEQEHAGVAPFLSLARSKVVGARQTAVGCVAHIERFGAEGGYVLLLEVGRGVVVHHKAADACGADERCVGRGLRQANAVDDNDGENRLHACRCLVRDGGSPEVVRR